jgi:hypothetical protein
VSSSSTPGYRDELDRWLGSIGDRAVALANQPPAYWIELMFRSMLTQTFVTVVPEADVPRLGSDALPLTYTSARFGFYARPAECAQQGVEETNATVTEMLDWKYREAAGADDWFFTVGRTAEALSAAIERGFTAPQISQALGPEGIGRPFRRRLAVLMVDSILYDEHEELRRELGTLTPAALVRCWDFGYYLSACDAALPSPAREELLAHRP